MITIAEALTLTISFSLLVIAILSFRKDEK
ncbi:hypothetical protein JOC86_004328 [Bacillus pakistanensis]|uniref:Holin-like toxin n=1 Tax=Rossellomorea pakistanensis TaxID=992288 RepID=A0ABS2NIR7_9BACI|nr:putative holin-like toxin [Bacillus pakistanensis]MBM7587754.1 hypothetical protein [Bacillus pakistanensis]MCP3738458.1 putative holin-like toxin [Rossellomorea sp. BNER]